MHNLTHDACVDVHISPINSWRCALSKNSKNPQIIRHRKNIEFCGKRTIHRIHLPCPLLKGDFLLKNGSGTSSVAFSWWMNLLACLLAGILDGSLLVFGAALRHGGDQTESHLDVQWEAFKCGFGVEFSQGGGLTV